MGFKVALKANVEVRIGLVEVHLELIVRELVAWLVLAVVFGALLYRIVGQVDQLVLEAAEYVLATSCSKVTLLVDVNLHVAVHSSAEDVSTNVKFSPVDQKWVVNILLHDTSSSPICR